jgi:hypothetical protein
MKTSPLFAPLAASLVIATVFASSSAYALTTADQYGSAVNPQYTQRTIVVDAHTRFVNVKHGETVTIKDGDVSVSWNFDGLRPSFMLSTILPAAATGNPIQVYVAPEVLE